MKNWKQMKFSPNVNRILLGISLGLFLAGIVVAYVAKTARAQDGHMILFAALFYLIPLLIAWKNAAKKNSPAVLVILELFGFFGIIISYLFSCPDLISGHAYFSDHPYLTIMIIEAAAFLLFLVVVNNGLPKKLQNSEKEKEDIQEEQVEKYRAMLKQGILSQEEFDQLVKKKP